MLVITLIKTAVCDNARTVVWEVPPVRAVLPDCARHGAHLGGVSPLLAPSMGIMSLCKGVYREVESEGSKWRSLVVTNRNHIVGYYIG